MAGSSLLTLLDDITTLLDDIALMSKVATKKTVGVLGDDLAVNAEQVSGVRAARELPVVWAVAKGSLLNKVIIVPLILLLSAFLPWLITPLLMAGGVFLCYEGAEKVWHFVQILRCKQEADHRASQLLLNNSHASLLALEQAKIKGAIRTDFILSLEIIVISISTMAESTLAMQAVALSLVAVGITLFVYGLVAIIVKIDDAGLYLIHNQQALLWVGQGLLWLAPALLKSLTFLGTVAMFLVGGGILVHSIEHYASASITLSHWLSAEPVWLNEAAIMLLNGGVGLLVGASVVALVSMFGGVNQKESG